MVRLAEVRLVRRARRWAAESIAIAVLVLICAFLADPRSSAGAAPSVPGAAVPQVDPSSNLSISIVPGSWTMAAGTRAMFIATVVGLPSDCSIDSLMIQWSLPGLSAYDGYLNTSSGSAVTLTVFPSSQGSASLEAESTGRATCSGVPYAISPSGSAEAVILAQFTIGDPIVAPNPAGLATSVAFGVTVGGGLGPYDTTLDFGDGNRGSLTLSSSGEAVFHHQYRVGQYNPQWTVVDGLGDRASLTAPQPVLVTTSLGAAIVGEPAAVDVGVSETLDVNVTGGLPPYFVRWWASTGETFFATPWKFTFAAVGPVLLQATVTDSLGMTTVASMTVKVVSPPTLGILSQVGAGDVGRPIPFGVNISGGVAPFNLTWSVVGGGGNGTALLPTDGEYREPAIPSLAGPLWIDATAVDAFGKRWEVSGPVAEIYPVPRIVLATATSLTECGVPLQVSGLVTGGAPPIQWVLGASLATNNSTSNSGTLNVSGSLRWVGVPEAPGNLTVVVTATDHSGVSIVATESVTVVSGVSARLFLPSPPIEFAAGTVSADVEGGRPPYSYQLSLTDGEEFDGNLSQAGPSAWTISPRVPGFLGVRLTVDDSLSAQARVVLTVVVTPGSPAQPPVSPSPTTPGNSAASSWWLGLLGLGGIVCVFLLPKRLRRRGRPPNPNGSVAAMRTIREYLRESDGLDRATLYFLAEDDGLGEDSAAEAVRRWMRAGRIVAEPGPENEEVLRWMEPGRGRTPSPASDETDGA